MCGQLRGLRGGDKPEVMLGVLQIIFRCDRVAAGVRVARELQIFFGDVMCVAANLHIGTIGFIGTGERVGSPAIVGWATTHPLVLTRSHFTILGCLFVRWRGRSASRPRSGAASRKSLDLLRVVMP